MWHAGRIFAKDTERGADFRRGIGEQQLEFPRPGEDVWVARTKQKTPAVRFGKFGNNDRKSFDKAILAARHSRLAEIAERPIDAEPEVVTVVVGVVVRPEEFTAEEQRLAKESGAVSGAEIADAPALLVDAE